MICLDNGLSVI